MTRHGQVSVIPFLVRTAWRIYKSPVNALCRAHQRKSGRVSRPTRL